MLRIWRFLSKSPGGGAGASTAPFNLRPLHNTNIAYSKKDATADKIAVTGNAHNSIIGHHRSLNGSEIVAFTDSIVHPSAFFAL